MFECTSVHVWAAQHCKQHKQLKRTGTDAGAYTRLSTYESDSRNSRWSRLHCRCTRVAAPATSPSVVTAFLSARRAWSTSSRYASASWVWYLLKKRRDVNMYGFENGADREEKKRQQTYRLNITRSSSWYAIAKERERANTVESVNLIVHLLLQPARWVKGQGMRAAYRSDGFRTSNTRYSR